MDKFLNFVLHGVFASSETLGLRPNQKKSKENFEQKQIIQEDIDLEKGDLKAILIAGLQVFGPIILIMMIILVISFKVLF